MKSTSPPSNHAPGSELSVKKRSAKYPANARMTATHASNVELDGTKLAHPGREQVLRCEQPERREREGGRGRTARQSSGVPVIDRTMTQHASDAKASEATSRRRNVERGGSSSTSGARWRPGASGAGSSVSGGFAKTMS